MGRKRAADADDKGSRMTAAEVEALVAERMKHLPRWWRAETPRRHDGPRLGRAAVPVNGGVWRKGKR